MKDKEIFDLISKIVDKRCKKKCGHTMTKDCKEEHCVIYNILDNAYYHLDMGWNTCLRNDLESLKQREVNLIESEKA